MTEILDYLTFTEFNKNFDRCRELLEEIAEINTEYKNDKNKLLGFKSLFEELAECTETLSDIGYELKCRIEELENV